MRTSVYDLLKRLPTVKMPHTISPMLATLADRAFDGEDWIFEIKWDGYRAIAEIEQGVVRLYSRNLNSFHGKYPTIERSLGKIQREIVLDGEIVVLDEHGISQFQLMQNYQPGKGTLVFYVFDILYLDGKDLRSLPLIRRKEILRSALPDLPDVKYSDFIENTGIDFFRVASEKGLEGIVGKRTESPYRTGVRSTDWMKVRVRQEMETLIGGYTEPRGGRKYIGALILGVHEGDDLVYVGHAGSGLNDRDLAEYLGKLRPIEQEKSPFRSVPKANAPAHWVRPELVCRVAFSGWTDDNVLRHPVILGLREDKPAVEVGLEKAVPTGEFSGKRDANIQIGGQLLKFTNLDKVFWPDEGITKGDMIQYYRMMATVILPYLKGRPESMNRHPDGIQGGSFYQKNVRGRVPAWMETVEISSDDGSCSEYLLCQDEATLLYMANLGCIEINPWCSRKRSLNSPDFAVVDLDPEDIGFDAVIATAQTVREVLDEADIPAFPKTSGATGIHIYIPLAARYSYEEARNFAKTIALLANHRNPHITSIERMPYKRQGKVYIDFLQNARGQTLAAPYSIRPRPGAPVSTPLKWAEVKPGLNPVDFNIFTIEDRIAKIGDLYKPVLEQGVDIEQALDRLERLVPDQRAVA